MDYNDYSNQDFDNPISYDGTTTATGPFIGANVFADENTILMRVFKWMALGLGISAVAALGAYKFLGELLYIAYIPLIIIELVLVFVFSLRLQKMSPTAAKVCFIAYSLIDGLTLSAIFFTYEITSIYATFFVAAMMFGAAALYGKVTKKDMGEFMYYGPMQNGEPNGTGVAIYHNDDKEYEECCKKHICEKIADFLYENNLITFEKYNCKETEKYGEMKGYLTVIDKNKYEHITIK